MSIRNLEPEAGEIARVLELSPGDITLILQAIQAIAEMLKTCRENRHARRSWASLREEANTPSGVHRAHRAVIRRLGAAQARRIGGVTATRYILGRYKNHKASELDALIAEATA